MSTISRLDEEVIASDATATVMGLAEEFSASLRGADLRGAYLRGADLRGAYLRGAYLSGANLRGADLRGADLRGADLRGADLREAYLRGADLSGANLRRADLGGAYLGRALGIVDAGQDRRGYRFVAVDDGDGGVRIYAGCRAFSSFDKARQHWIGRHIEAPSLQVDCLARVDLLEHVWRAKR